MADYISIPVVRFEQKGITCYVGHLTSTESKQLTFADSYPPVPEEGRLGYQRLPNPRRAKDFARYLKDMDSGFMTPILLNSRHPVNFRPFPGQSNVGELRFSPNQRLAKIDGQHRGMGVEEFLGEPEFPVPFMLFDQLGSEQEQQLFVDINREQKRVSMSHVLFIASEDPFTTIALKLNDDDRSPWHHRLNVIGAAGTGKSVTLQGLKESLELLLSNGRVKQLDEEGKYAVARNFWDVAAETWPEAWKFPKKHLLSKAVGLLGLSKSGAYLLADCLTGSDDPEMAIDVGRLRKLLGHAKTVNWASDGEFAGLGGRGGADRVSDLLDAYFFGGDVE